MQTATKGNTTWTYTYNADGLRIGKTNGTITYTYTWNENRQLQSMTWNYGYAIFSYDANGMPYSVKNYDAILDVERTYLYVTNLQGDVLSIIDASSGATAVTYTYDAWGRLIGKDGTSSDYASIYEYNPLTYRGYIYDSETGFYYLQSRYYDPTIGRFLNADEAQYVNGASLFSFCQNNPINNNDNYGYFGTPIQWICAAIGSVAGWFFGDYVARSIGLFDGKWYQWQTYAYWTVRTLVVAGGAIIGWVSGPYLLTIIKNFLLAQKALWVKLSSSVLTFLGLEKGFGSLSRAAEFGLQTYNKLRSLIAGTGLQAHHIIEQRFGYNIDICVAVTKAEHQAFTNMWRSAFPYGIDYSKITPDQLLEAAREIYKNYPSILSAVVEALRQWL